MSPPGMALKTKATRGTGRPHQPGQAVFKAILPKEIDWKPFAAFPPSVRLAVVIGQPSEDGPYTIRVKVLCGAKLMPHWHPEDRIYTVISGIFYIGLGVPAEYPATTISFEKGDRLLLVTGGVFEAKNKAGQRLGFENLVRFIDMHREEKDLVNIVISYVDDFSNGTESIYKIYTESFLGEDHLCRILGEAEAIVKDALFEGWINILPDISVPIR